MPAATAMPAKLARCAFTLFAERGIDRVTMDEIASRAGVTKGSLYWHYDSKHAIIGAACRHYYANWHRRMERELAPIHGPGRRLARAIRSSVRTCLIDQRNRTFTLELFTLSLHDAELRAGWREFFDDVRHFYVSLLSQAQLADDAADSDPEAAVDLMLAAMEGYKLRALFEPKLCAPGAERRIAAELLGLIGMPAS